MQVCIVGGFSSFGKRAIIRSWLSAAMEKWNGTKVTILLNGEVDFIDGEGLGEDGDVQVELFDEGCFCCTLRDSLTEALIEQRDLRKPSLVLMLASVITDLGQLGELINEVLGDEASILSVFSLDEDSAVPIIDSFTAMVERNVRSADTVVLIGMSGFSIKDGRMVCSKLIEMNNELEIKEVADIGGKKSIILGLNLFQ